MQTGFHKNLLNTDNSKIFARQQAGPVGFEKVLD